MKQARTRPMAATAPRPSGVFPRQMSLLEEEEPQLPRRAHLVAVPTSKAPRPSGVFPRQTLLSLEEEPASDKVHLPVMPSAGYACRKEEFGCPHAHCRYHVPGHNERPDVCALWIAEAFPKGLSPAMVAALLNEDESATQRTEYHALQKLRLGQVENGDAWDLLHEMVVTP